MTDFIFATPRSGNSFYANIHDYISHYSFIPSHFHKQSSLLKELGAHTSGYGLQFREVFSCIEYPQPDVWQNFETYKAMKHKPTISVIAGNTPDAIIEWMFDNCNPIWLERRNKFDQILSWGQAYYSKKYNVKRQLEPGSIEYLKADFNHVTTLINQYFRWRNIYCKSSHKQLYTEDILDEKIAGMDAKFLPEKNSNQDKLQYFSNQQQIFNWYKEYEPTIPAIS